MRAARDILRTLDVQLDAEDMFVLGVRRGYAIIPIKRRAFEDESARRARVQQAISRICNANLTTGCVDAIWGRLTCSCWIWLGTCGNSGWPCRRAQRGDAGPS